MTRFGIGFGLQKPGGWEGPDAPSGDRRRILTVFVEAGRSPGRPKEVMEEKEQKILDTVRKDRSGREKSSEVIRYELGWSSSTVLSILKKHGLRNVKPTTKPGLNRDQQLCRLAFALEHKDWTLEDWKNVIWSDETSVILGHRRGSVRVWRTVDEAYNKTTVRNRWKGYSEFMFWGCFSYDRIGPCHIWGPETAVMKKIATQEVAELNKLAEPVLRDEFELANSLRRTHLSRKAKGKKPAWNFNEANGKLVRKGTGGIDWFRYWKEILLAKLIPFAKECQEARPDTLVQEDNAPAHAHQHQGKVYALHDIARLLWPGNSPDLNPIEKAWYYLKRVTTARGAPTTRKEMEAAWLRAWRGMALSTVCVWIEGILNNIKQIIALNGGNNYHEGREAFKRNFKGRRTLGKLSSHAYPHPQRDQDLEESEGG